MGEGTLRVLKDGKMRRKSLLPELLGQLNLWVQWAPTPTCLTQASQDHMQKELGPRDKVPKNRTYSDPARGAIISN